MQQKKLIRDFKEPEIFLALKRMCRYVVDHAWAMSLGVDEVGAEFNLATAKTKRYKEDVKKLANLDKDLTWGTVKTKRGSAYMTTKEGDFNPWYDGSLTLQELLDSMEGLAEFLELSEPRYIEEEEYLHFYNYLRNITVSSELLKKESINSITFESLHFKIKHHCASRYRNGNYSDSVLVAYKVVLNEIKDITGIRNKDGKPLIEQAFSLNNPLIKLNKLRNQSDKDEQQGFMFLYSGAALGIRNPKAHDLVEQDDPIRALQLLAFASLLMDKLDERVKTK